MFLPLPAAVLFNVRNQPILGRFSLFVSQVEQHVKRKKSESHSMMASVCWLSKKVTSLRAIKNSSSNRFLTSQIPISGIWTRSDCPG
jgi:hypothetical protein